MNPLIWILPTAIVLLLIILFVRQIRPRSLHSFKEQREDTLKHILSFENQGQHATIETLASSLGLPVRKTRKLIKQMESHNLISMQDTDLYLTAEGKHRALHVIRAHRLWERYLFDEARMSLQKVHSEAHRIEHTLNETDVEALDASLGHPTSDPHGDPIPNREGKFAQELSTPLTSWPGDRPAQIVHLEDEPAIAFQTILAAGLKLGQTIRIVQISPKYYLLSDGEREYRLTPRVAANVFVAPVSEIALHSRDIIPLSELAHQQQAEIIKLDENVQGFTRRRFLDLGLTTGTLIYPELKNFFGDPRAYRVRGTLIALRRDQAAQVWVRRVEADRSIN